jgi:hypothetical protein
MEDDNEDEGNDDTFWVELASPYISHCFLGYLYEIGADMDLMVVGVLYRAMRKIINDDYRGVCSLQGFTKENAGPHLSEFLDYFIRDYLIINDPTYFYTYNRAYETNKLEGSKYKI